MCHSVRPLIPMPDRLISRRLPRPSAMVSSPRRTPARLGVNPTWTVQVAPGARETGQPLPTMVKSLPPATTALVTEAGVEPLFVIRTGIGRTATPGCSDGQARMAASMPRGLVASP